MKLALFTKNFEELNTEALVIGLYEELELESLSSIDAISDGKIADVISTKEFTGKFGKVLTLRINKSIKKIILIGLGKRDEFNLNKAREISAKAAIYVRENNIKEFSFLLLEDMSPFDASYTTIEAMKLALYEFNEFKTTGLDDIKRVEKLTLVANGNNFLDIDAGIKKALVVSDSVNYVRNLQNKPGNIVTASYLANEAQKIARKYNLKCTVLEKTEMEKLGMGGILAVNRGSSHPPKFIILEYPGTIKETICFIGKGITFDSGGISLKPAAEMEDMKFDMSGGAAVFGIMQAAASMKIKQRIVGIVPATDNLPGGSAYKPGDIIKMHNGKTTEITNTDAEGRLILADALSYSKRFNPKYVIDFATLTGACVISLGSLYSALFSNSEELAEKLTEAGNKTGESVWRMPLDERYKEYLKSNFADLKNASNARDAGAITAAVFLKEFVDNKNWAHIDIAGTAYTKNGKNPMNPYGGTGFGVRLGLEFLENLKKKEVVKENN
jgi:leucyl aminopeptidase